MGLGLKISISIYNISEENGTNLEHEIWGFDYNAGAYIALFFARFNKKSPYYVIVHFIV